MAPSFLNHVIFRPPPFKSYLFRTKLIHLKTTKGNTITATHIKRSKSAITLIFSHANGDDLNNCYSQMMALSRVLEVNVIGYDYSGYGKSTGQFLFFPRSVVLSDLEFLTVDSFLDFCRHAERGELLCGH